MHVEQNYGEVVAEQVVQCLGAGGGVYEVLTQFAQDHFQDEQVLPPVVHQQDVDLGLSRIRHDRALIGVDWRQRNSCWRHWQHKVDSKSVASCKAGRQM